MSLSQSRSLLVIDRSCLHIGEAFTQLKTAVHCQEPLRSSHLQYLNIVLEDAPHGKPRLN